MENSKTRELSEHHNAMPNDEFKVFYYLVFNVHPSLSYAVLLFASKAVISFPKTYVACNA